MGASLHELDSDFASVDAPASLKDDAESASSEFISKLILINEVLKEVVVVGQVRAYGGSQDGGRMCGTRRPRYLQRTRESTAGLSCKDSDDTYESRTYADT